MLCNFRNKMEELRLRNSVFVCASKQNMFIKCTLLNISVYEYEKTYKEAITVINLLKKIKDNTIDNRKQRIDK